MKEELAHLQIERGRRRSDFEPWNFNLVVEIITYKTSWRNYIRNTANFIKMNR